MKNSLKLPLALVFLSLCGLGFFGSFFNDSVSFSPIELNVVRDDGYLPMVQIEIGGEKKWALVDLGGDTISIDQASIDAGHVVQMAGNSYFFSTFSEGPLDIYSINEFKIGDFIQNDIVCDAPHPFYYFEEVSKEGNLPVTNGLSPVSLGTEAFNKVCLIMDLKKSKIFLLSSKNQLVETPYKDCMQVNLNAKFRDGRVEIPVTFQGKELHLVLDSGSSLNLLFEGEWERGAAVYFHPAEGLPHLHGLNLGPFIKTNLDDKNRLAGILGVPFFERHAVLVDFPNRSVFLLIPFTPET